MNIKMMYYRDDENTIWYDYEHMILDEWEKADTPQELVKVGDLVLEVSLEKSTEPVELTVSSIDILNGIYRSKQFPMSWHYIRDITAIYTPNTNGDFIKQWEDKQ